MKLLPVVVLFLILGLSPGVAQLKSQSAANQSVSSSLVHPAASISSFLGLLNPDNFTMRHNFSLNYFSSGGNGLSVASYTNSIFYKIADPLKVRFDVSLMGSPFGQYGSASQNGLNKIFLSRAELNYTPLENLFITVQYRHSPYLNYGYSEPYSMFNRWGDE